MFSDCGIKLCLVSGIKCFKGLCVVSGSSNVGLCFVFSEWE